MSASTTTVSTDQFVSDVESIRSEITEAMKLKLIGNEQLKRASFQQARETYIEALQRVLSAVELLKSAIARNEQLMKDDMSKAVEMDSAKCEIEEIRIQLISNLSLAELKLELWAESAAHASMVLVADPRNMKAMFRRAVARVRLGELLDDALVDLLRLQERDGGNGEITAEIARCRDAIKAERGKEDEFRKSFRGSFAPASDSQPPLRTLVDSWFQTVSSVFAQCGGIRPEVAKQRRRAATSGKAEFFCQLFSPQITPFNHPSDIVHTSVMSQSASSCGGAVTPVGGCHDEDIVIPLITATSPFEDFTAAYSPYRGYHDEPMEADDAVDDSPIVVPPIPRVVGGDFGRVEELMTKKKERRRRQRWLRKKRLGGLVTTPTSVVGAGEGEGRVGKKDRRFVGCQDFYYASRYKPWIEIDPRLAAIVDGWGLEVFAGKSVVEIGCGIGFVGFYIAAFLGAGRVVGTDADLETILLNLKQLRKFKHEGVRVTKTVVGEEYPMFCVKRMGVVRVTNKSWLLKDEYVLDATTSSPSSKKFPFNIEFRREDVMASASSSGDQSDFCLCWRVVNLVKAKYGDSSLPVFVSRLVESVRVGGIIFLESGRNDGLVQAMDMRGDLRTVPPVSPLIGGRSTIVAFERLA